MCGLMGMWLNDLYWVPFNYVDVISWRILVNVVY